MIGSPPEDTIMAKQKRVAVVLSGGKSPVVRDLRSLADRVVGSESPNGTRPPRGGLLGKMTAAMRGGRGTPSPAPEPGS